MRLIYRHRMVAALALAALLPAVFASALLDPTRPAGYGLADSPRAGTASSGGWVLNSTLVAPRRRVAVINGRQVSEGESVDGARVVEIRKLDVVIQSAGRRITLELLPATTTRHRE